MKTIKPRGLGKFSPIPLLILLSMISTQAQGFNITGATRTTDGPIQLTWQSQSNATYQIQEADALNANADGTTTWNTLYTEYPPQGSNTFWLDTGNYRATPAIVSSRVSSMRFYRVVNLGPDLKTDEPSVSILPIANTTNATDELTISVQAATDQFNVNTKLYVDGQQMNDFVSTTNWTDITGVTNYVVDTYQKGGGFRLAGGA